MSGAGETRGQFRARLRAMGIEPRRVGPYTWELREGKTVVAKGEARSQEQARTDARAAMDALPREPGKRRRLEFVCRAAGIRKDGGAR